MSRLVEAKVELLEAIERRDAADLEFRAAAARGALAEVSESWRRKQTERASVTRLVREIGELEAREAGLVRDFGPATEDNFA